MTVHHNPQHTDADVAARSLGTASSQPERDGEPDVRFNGEPPGKRITPGTAPFIACLCRAFVSTAAESR
jgi:hypothetical protein